MMNRVKRGLALVLLLLLVFAVYPAAMLTASAEEPVALTYEDLIVKNGLTMLLLPENADLSAGVWKDASGKGNDATVTGDRWALAEDGKSIGYTSSSIGDHKSNTKNKVYLTLPTEAFGETFFAELLFRPNFVSDGEGRIVPHTEAEGPFGDYNGDGVRSAFNFGGLQCCCFMPSTVATACNSECRFFYDAVAWQGGSVQEQREFKNVALFGVWNEDAALDTLARTPVMMTVGRTPASGDAVYTVTSSAIAFSMKASGGSGVKTYAEMDAPFEEFNGFPADVYAIRVYDRTLTEEETAQNYFADLVRYTGADLSAYAAMSAEMKAFTHKEVGKLTFGATKAEAESAIANAKAAYEAEEARKAEEQRAHDELVRSFGDRAADKYDKYYVQKGLIIWLDGMVTLPELNGDIDLEAGTWKSKVGNVTAKIGGAEYWSVPEDGQGIGYRFTLDEYRASLVSNICPAGIEFDPSLLPQRFTVDTVAKLPGLTNKDGTRFEDTENSPDIYGIYTGAYSTFSFGALKTMSFLCTSHASHGTEMGHRWCLTALEWNQHNGAAGGTNDFSLAAIDPDVAYAYTIVKNQPNAAVTTAQAYLGMPVSPTFSGSWNTVGDSEPEFHVFKGIPSTVYAVRVYDRVLSDAERSQNHMADLFSFYNLDTEFLDLVLSCTADPSALYASFDTVGFDLSREEAENAVGNALSGAWIRSVGISAKLSGSNGLRAVFEIDDAGIRQLEAAGYKVEIGALLNVGGDVPTMDSAQYKVVFRKEDGTKNGAFFLEDGTAAFAVKYNRATPELRVTVLHFAGYITLTDQDGNTRVLYAVCESEKYDNNAFSVYDYLRTKMGYGDNAYVVNAVDASFAYKSIDVAPGEGGIAEALAKLAELLAGTTPVDVTLRFGEGKFITAETLELDASQFENKYFRLTFRGEDGDKSVITSNREIDGNAFTKVEGKEYYKYQFEKNQDGAYPEFRFFYVNGRVQKVATNGYDRTNDAEAAVEAERAAAGERFVYDAGNIKAGMWSVPFDFDSIDNEKSNPGYKLYLHKAAFENLTDEELASGKVEFHMPIAWYYRVMHLSRVDRSDVKDGEYIAAYFVPGDLSGWSAAHHFGGCYYWLENALSFLDEPGEFFYDRENGTLYYYPEEGVDLADAVCEYPTLDDAMLAFIGTDYVTFDRMVIYGNDNRVFDRGGYMGSQATSSPSARYGDDAKAALYFENTDGVTIRDCLIHDVATTGVKFCGVTENTRIEHNRVFHIGSTGIEFGWHNGNFDIKKHANENVTVTNNYLDDIAWLTRGSIGIYVSVSRNLEISYNTVTNTSYSATSIGWRWTPGDWEYGDYWQTANADIHHNYYRGFMSDMCDGGAIYTLGGNAENGYHEYFNSLHDNYCWFDRTTWDGQGMVMPWYHDGGSSNWGDHDNVEAMYPFRVVHTPYYLQNIVEQYTHNIMVELCEFILPFTDWKAWSEDGELYDYDKQLFLFGPDGNQPMIDSTHYNTRVEEARDLRERDNGLYGHVNVIPDYIIDMIEATGSDLCKPDAYEMIDAMEPFYDLWYEKLEADYYAD